MSLRGKGLTFFNIAPLLSLLFALALSASHAIAQYQPPSQFMNVTATSASNWTSGGSSILQLDGPVTITLDRATLTAKSAVVWVEDANDGQPGEQLVSIALIDDARLVQPEITRSGDELLVTARVNGPIKITADSKTPQDLSDSPLFHHAQVLRLSAESQQENADLGATTLPSFLPTTQPTTGPTTRRISPVRYHAENINDTNLEGNVAAVLSGKVSIMSTEKNGEVVEMQCERAVLFTAAQSLHGMGNNKKKDVRYADDAITSAYLEGDVRIDIQPRTATQGEQRLEAERVYYDFTTDRAVLTEAVIHTVDMQAQIPIIVRAKTIKQLSEGEYKAEHAQVTASAFANPSYAINADKAYILEEPSDDPAIGTRTYFNAQGATFNVYGVPTFYLPTAAGVFTEHGMPLRALQAGDNSTYGYYVKSEWGLFETLGRLPPQDVDIGVRADYFSDRGPAFGMDGKYGGGFVSETSRQPYLYDGDFKAYFVHDDGVDVLGGKRAEVTPPTEDRGRVLWEHQMYFPDDWQIQIRTGWVSDATFREEWFEDEFNDGLPLETSFYLKKQRDTEAITFLASIQPNDQVTSADYLQENFEVEEVPQLGYHRIGDSFADDKLTFFSDDMVERVRFNESGADQAEEGFKVKRGVYPGQPSLGLVGVTGLDGAPVVPGSYTDVADFRQEVDYPFQLGHFKVMPYVIGRYTGYSDSVDGDRLDRGFAAAGIRFNTQIWQIDDTVDSEFWDIHRVRHIIEPELQLYTSASNVNPNQLYIYNEAVDEIYPTTDMQIALRQRWETKRGGPGNWRSVEFFSFNIEADLFNNQPPPQDLIPVGFHGIFYSTAPELSIPRNAINANATWRISDSTLLLSDAAYNLDEQDLATASVGLIAQRGDRTKYFLGLRYIAELNSEIATIAATYEMSPKYILGGTIAYDFGQTSDVYTAVSIERKFDRYSLLVTVYNDQESAQHGINFGFYPEGLGKGASSDAVDKTFNKTE